MYNYNNYNQNDYAGLYGNTHNYMVPTPSQGYSQSLVNSYDGFVRGNMYAELYNPYTPNEPFKLTPQNDKEGLLNKVREYEFALVDLNLYLDTHPEDIEKIKAYNQYLLLEKQATNEFETKYGPLTLCSEALNTSPWAWVSNAWPWEVI
ncbi:MAG: spore coat protein CotJB [Bacilli bacterium]|jgi:spore coat protein JB